MSMSSAIAILIKACREISPLVSKRFSDPKLITPDFSLRAFCEIFLRLRTARTFFAICVCISFGVCQNNTFYSISRFGRLYFFIFAFNVCLVIPSFFAICVRLFDAARCMLIISASISSSVLLKIALSADSGDFE